MSRPRQEGGGDGRPRGGADIQQGGATATATTGRAGGRAAQRRRGDAGEVDAQREAGLLQGLLRDSEGLQLLLTVGHVGVLAAATDTVQTRLAGQVVEVWGAGGAGEKKWWWAKC